VLSAGLNGFDCGAAGSSVTVRDLGGLPLRDWDEGTVAQVARDIYVVHLVLGAGFTRP